MAETLLHQIYVLFGAPEDVAAKHTLTRKAYLLLLPWIRCGEAMLRHLLLLEAQACPKPNTRPLLTPKRLRKRRLLSFEAAQPAQWRVSFRCFLADARARPAVREAAHGSMPASLSRERRKRACRQDCGSYQNLPPQKFNSAWPIAERYEALLRVFNNPEPYARRLSRRLHATPHRRRELVRPPNDEACLGTYTMFREAAEPAAPAVADTS